MSAVRGIFNYKEITPQIAMSGQPRSEQFEWVADADYDVVFHLDVTESDYRLAEERAVVEAQGLTYETMQLSFMNPTDDDVDTFFSVMRAHEGKRIYVHCTAGFCTCGLMYLYLRVDKGFGEEAAQACMLDQWKPHTAWIALIDRKKAEFGL